MYQNIRKLLFQTLIPAVLSVLLFPMAAWAAESSCSVSVPVNVLVSGREVPRGVPFTFVIESITPGAPMPEQTSITITDSGKSTFGPITFTAPDDYQYRIYQKSEPKDKFKFDSTNYTITARVIHTAEGGLAMEVWAVNGARDQKVDNIHFVNRYYDPSGSSGDGDSSDNGKNSDKDKDKGKDKNREVGAIDELDTVDDGEAPLGSLILEDLVALGMLPKTGDTAQALLWMILMAASGSGLVLLLVFRRRKDSNTD